LSAGSKPPAAPATERAYPGCRGHRWTARRRRQRPGGCRPAQRVRL